MKPIAVLCFGALLLTLPQTAAAQLFGGDSDRANIEFIPKSAFAGAVIFPARISKDPKFDLFPREIVTAWGIKELGFDPMLIKQATFLAQGNEQSGASASMGRDIAF